MDQASNEPGKVIWETNHYVKSEEIANAVTHGIGALLSIVGLVLMLLVSTEFSDPYKIVSASVYGASLILLFLISTLYHSFQHPTLRQTFNLLDHCAIYLLIAGTYTPFLLVSLKGPWGWSLLGVIWGLALAGIAFKIFFKHRFPKLSLAAYILMGWIVIIAIGEMIAKVPTGGLVLLVAGGVTYTLGAIFYAIDRIPYNHAIWHVFVLGGSICHFLSIYLYVLS